MSRGRLIPPNLDDRKWQDLVNQAKALIPDYWTDHNPPDLGITLIELFAWIADQIIYRLNRVPDKHFIEFLNLIGVTQDPPTPAQVELTFTITEDEKEKVVPIKKETQVSTPPIGTEEGVIFETDEDLHAVNLERCILLDTQSETKYTDYTARILKEPYETIDVTIPSSASATKTLLLGIAVSTSKPLSLTFKSLSESPPISPQWMYSQKVALPDEWPSVTPVTNASYAFERPGRVGIKISDNWEARQFPLAEDKETELFYWIGVRFNNTNGSAIIVHLNRVAANMTTATNALTIKEEEELGISNGKPFQVFQLKNTPLYQDTKAGDPLEHLKITVNGESWTRVEDFSDVQDDKPPRPEYMCNPVTGEISFGNYSTSNPDNPGYGKIPPGGSQIKAKSYRYVAGGSNGNVPKETINLQQIPGVREVINEEGASGGTDWEKLEDTKRRGPEILKVQDRAVTVEDYEYLARRATTDVAKVRCFPSKTTDTIEWKTIKGKKDVRLERKPGNVNLIIVPDDKEARQPEPGDELIKYVKGYLEERQTITSILIGPFPPKYIEIKVEATVHVKPGENKVEIKQNIQQKLFDFFHPIIGGPEGLGWEIGQDLYTPDVFAVIQSIPKVSYIGVLKIDKVDDVNPAPVMRIGIQEYELICASELNDKNYKIDVKEEELEF